MYAMGGYGYNMSPVDACRGEQCRKQVTAIVNKAEEIEKSLTKLDESERSLVSENEHDMTDINVFTSHDETKTLRDKIRAQNDALRQVRRTRVQLMRALYKLIGKLSVPQQGRLVRYLNLEHRVTIKYDDFTKELVIPNEFKSKKGNTKNSDEEPEDESSK